MATSSQIVICPHCNSELPRKDLPACPYCKVQILQPRSNLYGAPDYLWLQKLRLEDEAMKRLVKDSINKPTAQERKELEKAMGVFARNSLPEDRLAALQDARIYLSSVLFTKTPIGHLQAMTALAKEIGKLGQAIEDYFKNGGEPYDREVGHVQARPEDSVGSDEAIG
jgi:hypothetical protein